MKTLIQLPGDGNCLYNAILIGYVNANAGQYPLINGVEVRTQQHLRELVQQHYQQKLDAGDENLITCLKGMLVDIIQLKSFGGFSKSRYLRTKLEKIRSQYDASPENIVNDEMFFNEYVNQDLIQLYIDSITLIWGGWQEAMILSELLEINIRLSNQGVPKDKEIEVLYVGGNHYNVHVSRPHNDKVLTLIATIGGQEKEHNSSLKEDQISIISSLSDYKAHLLLQIIFNKREAERINKDTIITDAEICYAIVYIEKMYKIGENKNNLISPTSLKGSYTADNNSTDEDHFLKPTKLVDIFATQVTESTDKKHPLTSEEKYQLYYDDTSSEEGEQEKIESSSLDTIEEALSTTRGNFKGISEIDLTLSFLAHEFGIRLLKSKEVGKYYYPLKAAYLAKNKVLSDTHIKDCIKGAIRATIKELYQKTYKKVLKANKQLIESMIADGIANKRNFIRGVKKDINKIFSVLEKFKLPVKHIATTQNELVKVLYSVYEHSGVIFSPGESQDNTKTVFSTAKISKILEYSQTLSPQSIEKEASDRLSAQKSRKNLVTVAQEWENDLDNSKQKYSVTSSFMNTLQSKLLLMLKEAYKEHDTYRETLPSSFEISLVTGDNIAKFFAHIRLTTRSAIRMIKNFDDHQNILEDELETMTRSFSFIGLENKGVEKQTIYKRTGSRSDFVEIGKISNSGSYESIGIIIEKLTDNLKVNDIKVAEWVIKTLRGKAQVFSDELALKKSKRMPFEKFVNSLVHLLFGTEVVRNPASMIIHYMILELIIGNKMTWKDAFSGTMPMSIKEAVPASRTLHNKYQTSLEYSYDNAKDGEGTEGKVRELVTKEASIFKNWLSIKGIKVKKATPISEIIALLSRECFSWYGIEVRSKQLMVDMLLQICYYELSENELNDLSMNQLRTLDKIVSDIDVDDFLRLHENGKVLSILDIIKMYEESDKKFTDLSEENVIDFYKQLQVWETDITFDDICQIYDTSTDKLWDLIDNEKEHNLIEDHGLQIVSDIYDAINAQCEGNEIDYTGYSEDGIYDRVRNTLSDVTNESNSDESNGSNEDILSSDSYSYQSILF